MCDCIPLLDPSNIIEEVSVFIRWANLDFCVSIEHHYDGNSFFGGTISHKYLLRISSVFGDSEVTFLAKRRKQPFVHLSFMFYLYTALQNCSKLSDFLLFHNSGGITLSSWVKSSNLMSIWLLIIFVIGWFPRRFLKCSFHIYIRFSWLSAFSFAIDVLFLYFTSFPVGHAVRDCLSSTEFLI